MTTSYPRRVSTKLQQEKSSGGESRGLASRGHRGAQLRAWEPSDLRNVGQHSDRRQALGLLRDQEQEERGKVCLLCSGR